MTTRTASLAMMEMIAWVSAWLEIAETKTGLSGWTEEDNAVNIFTSKGKILLLVQMDQSF